MGTKKIPREHPRKLNILHMLRPTLALLHDIHDTLKNLRCPAAEHTRGEHEGVHVGEVVQQSWAREERIYYRAVQRSGRARAGERLRARDGKELEILDGERYPAPTQAMFDRIRTAPADLGLTDVYNGLQALEEPAAIRTQPPMEAEMVVLATNRHVSGNVWEEEEGMYELQSTPSMIAARMAPPV
ncbi:uncharacterized protein B0H18DRAFT_1119202 [Fomitopsis serialis]|uniref:uncharacterized protein n=1 Tax=Fomitopsis serialis TaxID=139415 RepID=UPI002008CA7B|nr:uncharacterized protein B0H18DRAFT_1119202 [Neoantrodia serialis]KAH9926052.1 hypothetical protein B0H18DRAFT_1119202 [Neoantrodia serialis]